MPWQPPIPSGMLYSQPAQQLGSGLALLAYCYDKVQHDGWLGVVWRVFEDVSQGTVEIGAEFIERT